MSNQVIWHVPGMTGTYQFSPTGFAQMPFFDWANLFYKLFLHPLPALPDDSQPQPSGASRSGGASWVDVSPASGAAAKEEFFEC